MARKSSKSKPSAIVTADVYSNNNYILKESTLSPLKKLSYKSSNFYTTFLSNKDIIIAPIEVAAGIDDDDLEGMIEDRAYEELNLDPAQEYIIRYQEIETGDKQKKIFQLFVIDREKYSEIFEPLRKEIKYIDQIMPAPLLYGSLYSTDALKPKGVHVFLYFTHYDTFVTFYRNGKYLYSKSIPFSLRQIYNRYCEMVEDVVDEENFYKTLQKDGLRTLQSDFQQNLMKLFGEIFISINDIIIYTKRAYDLEVIDQMFIGSDLGAIAGLDEYVRNYLGFHSTPLEFNFDLESEEWHTDQLQYMLATSARNYFSDPDTQVNFTLYPKPPTFFKRPAGQMTAMVVLGLAAALALPIYHYVSASMNNMQVYKLRKEEKELSKEVAKYKRILSQKKEELKNQNDVLKGLSKRFAAKEKTLQNVYETKVEYRMKSDQLVSFSSDMSKYDVKTNAIASNMDGFSISIVAPSDKKITEMIKDISKKYYSDIESIDIQTIEKDTNSTFYQGILKVRFK